MSHRQTWTNNTGGLATLPITLSAIAHDCLIAFGVTDSVSSNFTWPAGFTQIANLLTTTDGQRLGVAIKNDADGTETSLNISVDSGYVIGGISAFNVRDNATPQDATAVTNNNNAGQSSPASITTAITPANNNADIVSIIGTDVTANNESTSSFSDTGGLSWTVRADVARTDNFFYNVAIGSANQATAATTTVTAQSTFASGTAGVAVVTIALKAAAAAATSAPPPRAFPAPILNF